MYMLDDFKTKLENKYFKYVYNFSSKKKLLDEMLTGKTDSLQFAVDALTTMDNILEEKKRLSLISESIMSLEYALQLVYKQLFEFYGNQTLYDISDESILSDLQTIHMLRRPILNVASMNIHYEYTQSQVISKIGSHTTSFLQTYINDQMYDILPKKMVSDLKVFFKEYVRIKDKISSDLVGNLTMLKALLQEFNKKNDFATSYLRFVYVGTLA